MQKRTYRILASLYELLAEYDPKELVEASNQQGLSSNLRNTLRYLANETPVSQRNTSKSTDAPVVTQDRPDSQPKKPKVSKKPPTQKKPAQAAPSLYPEIDEATYRDRLFKYLSDEGSFATKDEIISFAHSLGLNTVEVNPKESKERTARKVAMAGSQDPQFRVNLNEAIIAESSEQTRGWVGLISGDSG